MTIHQQNLIYMALWADQIRARVTSVRSNRLILILALPLLSACGQYHWTNSSNPNANFNSDLDFCAQRFDESNSISSDRNGINQSPNVALHPIASSGVINEQYIPPANTGCEGGAGLFGCNAGYPSESDPIDNCLMSKGWRQRRN